ncbi:hypothetical protein ACLOJK_034200 [Asimina triloba]
MYSPLQEEKTQLGLESVNGVLWDDGKAWRREKGGRREGGEVLFLESESHLYRPMPSRVSTDNVSFGDQVKERSCWDSFMSMSLVCLGLVGRFLPPSSVPYGSSPYFLSWKRDDLYSKQRLFGDSSSIIISKLEVGHTMLMVYKLEESSLILHLYSNLVIFATSFADRPFFLLSFEMAEKHLVMSEDLDVIQDNYNIPSSIILSPPTSYETPRDYRPGHLCLNEYMLRAGIQIPFEFGVADALLAFHISLVRYAAFSAWDNVKAIDNPPDPTQGWESRSFFAQLSSERDI